MELMTLLPEYYQNNRTMCKLQEILAEEINHLADSMGETIDQCFINTATDLLSRYERIYGIQVDVYKTNEFRRERIRAKLRGIGTVTKQMLKEVARSYSGGEVEVIENAKDYSFTIKFVGEKGIPANMGDLKLTIEEIKPAHLRCEFEFTYNTWRDISNMTWLEAGGFTWSSLKER